MQAGGCPSVEEDMVEELHPGSPHQLDFCACGAFFKGDFLRASINAFKKSMPDSASMMMLIKRPSTVVIIPFWTVQTIPARGTSPRTTESTSIIVSPW